MYVAINSQYHDYVELFKSWFGDNVDQKIIESAIKYSGSKMWIANPEIR